MTPVQDDNAYRLSEHRIGNGPRRVHTYDNSSRVTRVRERNGTCSATTSCASGYTCESSVCWRTTRDFAWNSFNLPTQITYSNPSLTRTFGYDAQGNRVRKTQNADNQVLYVGKLYEQRNLDALNVEESVYRLYTDVGVVAELVHPWGSTTNRTTRYLFTDHQGSIAYSVVNRELTQLGFFPYGKRMNTAPAQNFSQLGYTGHYQDDDLGLIDMGGRIYDPTIRRFLTRDVVADSPLQVFGTHAYAYVAHDPVNNTDPTGFFAYQGQGSSSEDCRITSTCPIPIIVPQPPKSHSQPPPLDPGVVAGQRASQAAWQGQQEKQRYINGLSESERAQYDNDVRAEERGAYGGPSAAGRSAEVAAFLEQLRHSQVPDEFDPFTLTFDPGTERLIGTLRSDLQALVREHLATLKMAGLDGRVVQGSRTLAEQAALYAQGRTTPGSIVTNARPGTSPHNSSAAYDLGLFENGKYKGSSPLYSTAAAAAAPSGLVWGGSIPSISWDVGHYQLPNWQNLPPANPSTSP